jgi:hypothetical protein
MKKIFIFFLLIHYYSSGFTQELFVFTEPASNMPAHSLSTKLSAISGDERHHYEGRSQRYIPEIMFGISKNLMIHAAGTFSNMYSRGTRWESVYVYGKYRFLSRDEVHQHFRMAAFAEGSYSRNKPFFEDLGLQGDRSGIQTGIIATQLINKFAASATASFIHAFNGDPYTSDQALNYSLSTGLLILPREYKSYDQLNLNLYLELLGQKTLDLDSYYIDLAPAIQFIFNSNSKVNMGYRFQLDGDQFRSMKNYFLLSFEHTFFNALKK